MAAVPDVESAISAVLDLDGWQLVAGINVMHVAVSLLLIKLPQLAWIDTQALKRNKEYLIIHSILPDSFEKLMNYSTI